jgi:hypothetical protein
MARSDGLRPEVISRMLDEFESIYLDATDATIADVVATTEHRKQLVEIEKRAGPREVSGDARTLPYSGSLAR